MDCAFTFYHVLEAFASFLGSHPLLPQLCGVCWPDEEPWAPEM